MKSSTIRVSECLQEIAKALDESIEYVAGERVAFTLIVFTEGMAQYISNAARADSVREIKHLLGMWEQGMPDIPAHEVKG